MNKKLLILLAIVLTTTAFSQTSVTINNGNFENPPYKVYYDATDNFSGPAGTTLGIITATPNKGILTTGIVGYDASNWRLSVKNGAAGQAQRADVRNDTDANSNVFYYESNTEGAGGDVRLLYDNSGAGGAANNPAAFAISPDPSTVVSTTEVILRYKMKLKFSNPDAINGDVNSGVDNTQTFNLSIVSSNTANANRFPTEVYTKVGTNDVVAVTSGITNGATARGYFNAVGLTANTWYDAEVEMVYADVSEVNKIKVMLFQLGKIGTGHKVSIDDIEMEIDEVTTLSAASLDMISENVEVYPNPATSILNYTKEKISSIEIINIAGQTIKNENATGSVDVSKLTNGVYFLRLHKTDGNTAFKKFVVK